MDNKQIALQVLTGAFVDRDPGVVARYFAPDYIQHNPAIANGPAQPRAGAGDPMRHGLCRFRPRCIGL